MYSNIIWQYLIPAGTADATSPPPPDREVKLLPGTEGANFYIDESDTEHNKEEEEIKKVSLFFTTWGHK